ncbi:exocyst complex component Sec15p [[Candida] anglica]|uniref:Exocyst complex component SEC15 n=1 Tax=[Candida] anglica TaxID=148631 RepID=A0ABP0ELD0_9ASCO
MDSTVPSGSTNDGPENLNLENLLLREDIFQSSLNSEEYLESLAPIIKDAIRANGLSSLIHKLNDIVKDKDEELNTLSLNSTRDINTCIDSIDNIHQDSSDLNKELSQISISLNKSVFELIGKKKTLIKCKEISSKIGEANMVLNMCLQVLEITNKIHELIKQHRYFSALKLIDELTSIHLPKVSSFSFAVKIYDSVPHLTRMIQDESFDNLGKWLAVNLERKLLAIGEGAFDNVYSLQEHWDQFKKEKTSATSAVYAPHKLNSPIELSIREPSLNYNVFEDQALQISLTTLYDAILVYQTLGEEELLSKLYYKEWLKKYNRIIYPITSSTTSAVTNTVSFSNMANLDEYLKKISGFFVMDKQINRATKYRLRTEANSNDLWDSYSIKLKPVLLNYLKVNQLDIDDLTSFKDLIGNFLQVMESNGYKVIDMYEVLMVIFKEYYAPELIAQFRIEFLESIQSDHYMPLVVQDEKDYENVMKICWYKPGSSFSPQNVRSMPISFPFSEDYVHYCLGVRSLLEDIIQFISRHYGYELNQLNNIIVNDIFEQVLGEEKGTGISYDLKEFIGRNSNNKEIVSQSYTNLEYYLYSLYEVGKLLNRRLRIHTGLGIHNIDSNGKFTLRAVESFTRVRKFAEDSIFEMVDSKIRELLDMVEYDTWMPEVANVEANYSIKDFALFLENLFTSIFASLPSTFRTLGLFRSYDFVAEHFLEILKNVPQYNRIAIANFDLDIRHLEESMSNLHATTPLTDEEGGGSVALQSTFTELRQCIDILKLDNYDDYIKNPTLRMRRFDRVRFEDGVKLISKMQLEEGDDSFNDDSIRSETASPARAGSPSQSILSTSAASKFAKFSSKFRKTDL